MQLDDDCGRNRIRIYPINIRGKTTTTKCIFREELKNGEDFDFQSYFK